MLVNQTVLDDYVECIIQHNRTTFNTPSLIVSTGALLLLIFNTPLLIVSIEMLVLAIFGRTVINYKRVVVINYIEQSKFY